jgi:integrase
MSFLSAFGELDKIMHEIDGAYAPNTLRAYRADMHEFIGFALEDGESGMPYSSQMVRMHIESVAKTGLGLATIKRKVASIGAIHRLADLPDPTKANQVRLAMRRVTRLLGSRSRQAHPVTRELLGRLLAVCGNDLRGARNQALLLLAYDSMRRRSELVSLRVEDIDWQDGGGALVLLRRSKTDQTGSGTLIHLTSETTRAVRQWLDLGMISDGFILRGVNSGGCLTRSLCESRVGRIYKRLARHAHLPDEVVRKISGHSMRVGGAQDLLREGASLPQIMIRGGWGKTDTVLRYVERLKPLDHMLYGAKPQL